MNTMVLGLCVTPKEESLMDGSIVQQRDIWKGMGVGRFMHIEGKSLF